jgi:hypothetical protein
MSFTGKVLWGAVMKGLNTAIALGSFLYMIRMSVHGTASEKNIPNLARTVKIDDSSVASPTRTSISRPPPTKARTFSEVVDMEAVMQQIPAGTTKSTTKVIRAKPTNSTLKKIWIQYGDSQFLSATVGGFACAPSVGAAPTIYMVRAILYFQIDLRGRCCILPCSFPFLSISLAWKALVHRPDIGVLAALTSDLLTAVFVGIALSTFMFVASFFKSGLSTLA